MRWHAAGSSVKFNGLILQAVVDARCGGELGPGAEDIVLRAVQRAASAAAQAFHVEIGAEGDRRPFTVEQETLPQCSLACADYCVSRREGEPFSEPQMARLAEICLVELTLACSSIGAVRWIECIPQQSVDAPVVGHAIRWASRMRGQMKRQWELDWPMDILPRLVWIPCIQSSTSRPNQR